MLKCFIFVVTVWLETEKLQKLREPGIKGGWEENRIVPWFGYHYHYLITAPRSNFGLHILSCCEHLWKGQDRCPPFPDGKPEQGSAHTSPAEPGRSEERVQFSPR